MRQSLTLKQNNFIEETIRTLNPTLAVRKSYDLGSKGGSKTLKQRDNTASAIASENLRKPHIVEELKKAQEELNFSKENRLKKLADIFWNGKNTEAILANKEITQMVGEYAPAKTENKNLNINANLRGEDLDRRIQRKIEELKRLNE